MFLSVFSLFLNETPRVSFREQVEASSNESQPTDEYQWPPYINKEYENSDNNNGRNSPLSEIVNQGLAPYRRLSDLSSGRSSYLESISRSLWTSLSMTIAFLVPTAVTMVFLYLDLKTTDLCIEWQHHNHSVPLSVKRLRVIGDSVEAMVTNLWFPLTTVVLFGWKVFKAKYFSTFYVSVIFGLTVIIYYLFLQQFGVYNTHVYYRYPGNVLFLTGIIVCSIAVLHNIRAGERTVSYSNFHILGLVSTEFLMCSLLSFVYRYAIVSFFNSVKEDQYKFMIAAIAPALTIIPAAICKHIALRRSSEVVHPGRSFVLAYFVRGGVIYLYRTMQADFKNIWLFVGLSLFASVLNFLKKASNRIRIKMWRCIIGRLKQTICCKRLKELPSDTPHNRRLKADLEIQDMLFEYSTLVLSQGYFVLYFVESFELSVSYILFDALRNTAIGIAIDFFFNVLSIFLQIHYYNIPIGRVWTKHWKRHLLANLILVMVSVSYFSSVLLSVFHARVVATGPRQGTYTVKNCTLF